MEHSQSGIGTRGLFRWGMAFAICGVVSGAIQQGILGGLTGKALLTAMEADPGMMTAATAALLLQALEACAVPVFACLIATGEVRILPLAIVAVVSEIPFDLLCYGRPFAMAGQNPVMGLVIAGILIYFFRRYPGTDGQSLLIKAAVLGAGLVWCGMLRVKDGSFVLIVTAILWALRNRPLWRNFAGVTAGVLCSLLSPFYLASPLGFLLIHFQREDREIPGFWGWLAYPAALLLGAGFAALA